jgi:hypothetical protein
VIRVALNVCSLGAERFRDDLMPQAFV